MKVVSWNVNGIRACVKKGFNDFFEQIEADIFCVQEIKCQEGQIELPFEGYEHYWNYAEKKGIPVRLFLRSNDRFLSNLD